MKVLTGAERAARHHDRHGDARAGHRGMDAAHRAFATARSRATKRTLRCEERPDVLERHAARAARDPPQRAALVAHDPRHRHRRRGRDHDGHDRRGRDGAGAGGHPEARHESAAGVSRPGLRRRWRLALLGAAVHDGGRARDRETTSPACAPSHRASNTQAQAIYGNSNWSTQVTGTTDKYLEVRDWPLDLGPQFLGERAARRRCGLPARRHGASRSCSATRIRSACRSGSASCRAR